MSKVKHRDRLPDIEREYIVSIAKNCIRSKEGKDALSYLKSDKRLFSDEEIEVLIDQFNIGYMPPDVNNSNDAIHEFAGKLIIPVYDHYGNLVALSSRDWRKDAYNKFYHESFKKSNILYGLNISKHNILRTKFAILVEGEFDVMSLFVKGFNNVVGILSSTINLYQISILRGYCSKLVLIFDGDHAGESASDKVKKFERYRECNRFYDVNIYPVFLPKDLDPDEFIHKHGRNALKKLIIESRQKADQK